jgi:high affinity Mn2+ porin
MSFVQRQGALRRPVVLKGNWSMLRIDVKFAWRASLLLAALSFLRLPVASAQESAAANQPRDPDPPGESADPDSLPVMFPHPETDRLWLSGQANFISQWHPGFHSPYSGKNSLSAEAQDATSRVLTLFTGLTSTSEILCDVQETGGHGVGEALGLAGFLNLDVVRNPSLGKAPYIARLMWHQIIPLSHERAPAGRNPFSLFSLLPERCIEIRFGKLSMADFFDLNSYGTDSNFQFMNWTVDNNGAYDYAADTRGFTFAAMAEYHHNRHVIVRFAEALMPKVANGIHLDADLSRARRECGVGTSRWAPAPARRCIAAVDLREPREHGRLPNGDR